MVLLLAVAATLAVAYYTYKWYTVWQYSEKFPGPTAWPLVGNAAQLGNNSYDYLHNLIYYVKKYDFQAFRAWIGSQLYVIITDPKDVEIILSTQKHNDKFDDYRFLHSWIGTGLITTTGSNWFRQRRIITPTFHFNILHDFHITMNANMDKLLSKMNGLADSGKSFDAQHLIHVATLDVICETAMGVQLNALDNQEHEMVGAFHDAARMVFHRIFSAWKRFDLLWALSDDYQTNLKAVTLLRTFNQSIITQRKEQLIADLKSNNNVEGSEHTDDSDRPKKRKVFLDILLTTSVDGVTLSDQEINDEVSTFMFAGHDTTAAAIAIGLWNMSIHPAEQQKCYEEQIALFGTDTTRNPSYQELQDMKYMEMFIKESQRIAPAVPFIGRRANEGLVLSNGRKIPAGTSIGILLYVMGHNPAIFPNPEHFDPLRFSSENRAHKNPYEYVPFSAGSRNCIGQKFAYNELRLVLAQIVRHFEVLPPEKPFAPLFTSTSTTHSNNGIWIRLKRRTLPLEG